MFQIDMKRTLTALFAVLHICNGLYASNVVDKDIYLDLMEEAVMAYTPERIEDYIARVDRDGIHEHGFPRLASNIGILVAKGRIPQYKDLFVRLMDLAVRFNAICLVRGVWLYENASPASYFR